jgi:hypothetical protein
MSDNRRNAFPLKGAFAFVALMVGVTVARFAWVAEPIPTPQPVLDHIPEAQSMDQHIVASDNLANIYFVFGAKHLTDRGHLLVSYYYPNQRDLDRQHDLSWFKANHPDWVTYLCDQTTPSYGYVYGWGAYVPVDTANPDVRNYLLNTYFVPAIRSGYRVIALDNVSIDNSDRRCGVWKNGAWVQQFSGEPRDAKYTASKMDYLSWIVSNMHQRHVTVAMNAKVDRQQPELTQRMVDLADIWIDEGAFLADCRGRSTDDLWELRRRLVQSTAPSRAYISINKSCAGSLAEISKEDADYVIASFLVVRTPLSYLSFFGLKEAGRRVESPYVREDDIGFPMGPAQNANGVWWRRYSGGLAIVNPSSKQAASFHLPPGAWRMDGKPTPVTLDVTPATGLILTAG